MGLGGESTGLLGAGGSQEGRDGKCCGDHDDENEGDVLDEERELEG